MLEVDAIEVRYGNIVALNEVTFRVDEGEIVTLIGANGAGKSTSLRSVSGLLPLSAGSIRFEGESIDRMRPEDIVRKGIAHSPEGRRVFPGLTVAENLELGATPWRKRGDTIDADIEGVYALFPRLKERHKQLAWSMSGGGATNACRWPCANGPPQTLAARRAFTRISAHYCRAIVREDCEYQSTRGYDIAG